MSKRWRRILTSAGLLLAIGTCAMSCLIVFLRQIPAFYLESSVPESEARKDQAAKFSRYITSFTGMIYNGDSSWNGIFTADQINSYFQEDEYKKVGGDKNLPEGFSEPRIQMDNDRIRIGCRYGRGYFSSIISIDLKVWLVAEEPNTLAVEIVALKIGSVPISPRWMLEPLAEAVRKENAEITWYRRDGHPVALVHLQADQIRPNYQLRRFEVQKDQLILQGQSISHNSRLVSSNQQK